MMIQQKKQNENYKFKRLANLLIMALLILELISCTTHRKVSDYEKTIAHAPTTVKEHFNYPEHIILTWKNNPSTSQAVTWRTDSSGSQAFAEIVLADPSPKFRKNSEKYQSETTEIYTEDGLVIYHSVNFINLLPQSLYAYRVSSGEIWSEWFHFRTASYSPDPFLFIYLGDAQTKISSLWSRAVRSAYSYAPTASFIIHAGDLVNQANSDQQWSEWFKAGGWIFAMMPSIPVVGNHEYENDKNNGKKISKFWRPQFMLPEYLSDGLEELVYYIDYQGVRIIALNSNEGLVEQARWLEDLLKDNPNKWTIVTFHHPIFSSTEKRDNKRLRNLWKSIFGKYKVDMVLQGHDHNYARGRNLKNNKTLFNQESGTMYIISVSGPKMYKQGSNRWMDRAAENTQLFQVISITNNTLHYEALTVTGELYDSFDLIKREGASNLLVEKFPPEIPERTFQSTPGIR
jgi:3',5'-cyclic AMP phosphodiesterase CpdA